MRAAGVMALTSDVLYEFMGRARLSDLSGKSQPSGGLDNSAGGRMEVKKENSPGEAPEPDGTNLASLHY